MPNQLTYYLYYEIYPGKGYELTSALSLGGPWNPIPSISFDVPKGFRHGSMIAITKTEYDSIVKSYGLTESLIN